MKTRLLQNPFSASLQLSRISRISRLTRAVFPFQHFSFSAFQLFPALALLLLTACTIPRPLKGGRALTAPTLNGGLQQTLLQGDNPSQPSTQHQETLKIRTYALPAGTRIDPLTPADGSRNPQPATPGTAVPIRANSCNSCLLSTLNSQPSTIFITEREESRATTELGAAQKDTAREVGARLSSLKPIVWVGIALFLFGLASLVWPPLRAVIGSVTTSAAMILGGLALIVLPTLIVGNELLLLGTVALAIAAWFLAHRHGELRGQLAAVTAPPPPSPAAARSPYTLKPREPKTP